MAFVRETGIQTTTLASAQTYAYGSHFFEIRSNGKTDSPVALR